MRHEEYWELRESPFRTDRNATYFFAAPTHEEALARLHFLTEDRRTLGIVTGGDGVGKSFQLEVFARSLHKQGRPACVASLMGLDVYGFCWTLAASLGISPPVGESVFGLWRRLGDRLREGCYTGEPATLLLDDAGHASPEVAARVVQLLKAQPRLDSTIVLAAHATRLSTLGQDLLSLCELHIRLERWTPADLRDFLHASTVRAGRNRDEEIFDESAVVRLHELTDGIPRRCSLLAELALVAGAGRRLDCIDADTIDAVFHELSLTAPVNTQAA